MSKIQSLSDIAVWYRGKSVLVTGATGFMGKVLVEKLLRSCPDIGTIFLMIREKKSVSTEDRVHEMIKSPLFDTIRGSRMDWEDKLVAVSGDIGLPNLGISDEDRNILQRSVSLVFHVAATIKFDEPMRRMVAMNLEGTEAVLQLSKEMTNLAAFVYVSTAFTNCTNQTIQERVYPPPFDVDKIKHCLAGLDDDLLELITPRLIDKHPNAYTFTKALAEHVVAGYSNELPIIIVRPSMVTASWMEPKPGWIDNYGGPTPFLISFEKGLLKSAYGEKESIADMIPVDLCINLIIAAAWEIGNREAPKLVPDVLMYNCVSGALNSITWGSMLEEIVKNVKRHSVSGNLMKPTPMMTNYRILHNLANFFYQALPATLIDCFTWITGGKPRLRYYARKINKAAAMTEYFTTGTWKMEAKNGMLLKNRMSAVDQEIFNFDVTKIDWEKYMNNYFIGIRENLLQDKSSASKDTEKPIAGTAFTRKTPLRDLRYSDDIHSKL